MLASVANMWGGKMATTPTGELGRTQQPQWGGGGGANYGDWSNLGMEENWGSGGGMGGSPMMEGGGLGGGGDMMDFGAGMGVG